MIISSHLFQLERTRYTDAATHIVSNLIQDSKYKKANQIILTLMVTSCKKWNCRHGHELDNTNHCKGMQKFLLVKGSNVLMVKLIYSLWQQVMNLILFSAFRHLLMQIWEWHERTNLIWTNFVIRVSKKVLKIILFNTHALDKVFIEF